MFTHLFSTSASVFLPCRQAPLDHLADEWIKKRWQIDTTEYYSTVKRTDIGSFAEMWLDLARVHHTECSKSEGEKQSYINTYMWNLCCFVCVLGLPTSPSWNYSWDINPPLIPPTPKCPLYASPLQVWACSTWHMPSWQQSALLDPRPESLYAKLLMVTFYRSLSVSSEKGHDATFGLIVF